MAKVQAYHVGFSAGFEDRKQRIIGQFVSNEFKTAQFLRAANIVADAYDNSVSEFSSTKIYSLAAIVAEVFDDWFVFLWKLELFLFAKFSNRLLANESSLLYLPHFQRRIYLHYLTTVWLNFINIELVDLEMERFTSVR